MIQPSKRLAAGSVAASRSARSDPGAEDAPWGETRYTSATALPTSYQYTGQRRFAAQGLYYYAARWYDPAIGHFIQADSIIPGATSPQAWDRYSYVLNNPVRLVDHSGNRPCMDNDKNGGCIGDPDFGKKPVDVPLTKQGREMLDRFIHFNSQPGWWNDNKPYSMSLNQFVGLWTLWERSDIEELEKPLTEAVSNQLWMNNEYRLGRSAYCTPAACFNGIFNFMAVQGGGHNANRFSGKAVELVLLEESTFALMAKAENTGRTIRAYDPSRVAYNPDVPWNWGNDEAYYNKVSSVHLGYGPSQIIEARSQDFVLFTINQANFCGFKGIGQ